MHLVCDCLNIKVVVENFLDLEKSNLILNVEERNHPYFSTDVYITTGKISGISKVLPRLIKNEIIGSWNICQCLMCNVFTHGTNYVTGTSTCSSTLKEEPGDFKTFGRDRNVSYSKVFQICFPSYLDVSDDFLNQLPNSGEDTDFFSSIHEKAESFLLSAEKKIKSNANTTQEKQSQALEILRRRVLCEERYLQQLVFQSKTYVTEALRSYLPSKGKTPNLQKPKLSEKLSKNEIQTEGQLSFPPVTQPMSKPLSSQSSALEDIFEMDDVLPSSATTGLRSYHTDEIEEEEESELLRDEDLSNYSQVIPERKNAQHRDIARSVPVDIPSWPAALGRKERGIDMKRPKDPQEIAASMQELARSFRTSSVDVFGDLPRRNISHKS